MNNYAYFQKEIDSKTIKFQILFKNEIMSFADWIGHIQQSEDFILYYNQLLKESKYKAYFWEVRPVTINQLSQNFEFVLVESTALLRIDENDSSFKRYFVTAKQVVSFPNIKGDAQLVVPTPLHPETEYAHLGKFLRSAADSQIVSFWKKVAEIYSKNISHTSKWLSTSGLGVHWLHVRIDSKPKYYQHKDYKREL